MKQITNLLSTCKDYLLEINSGMYISISDINLSGNRNYLSIILSTPHMQKLVPQLSMNLTFASRQCFSRMLMDSASNPIKERVMSTPQWPVPYYQRIFKAYPVRQQKKINLRAGPYDASDVNWYRAKQTLNQTLQGRQLVSHTQNHVKTKTYLIIKNDCETMAKAYVEDIGQFLDIANRENVRILGGKTLI